MNLKALNIKEDRKGMEQLEKVLPLPFPAYWCNHIGKMKTVPQWIASFEARGYKSDGRPFNSIKGAGRILFCRLGANSRINAKDLQADIFQN